MAMQNLDQIRQNLEKLEPNNELKNETQFRITRFSITSTTFCKLRPNFALGCSLILFKGCINKICL